MRDAIVGVVLLLTGLACFSAMTYGVARDPRNLVAVACGVIGLAAVVVGGIGFLTKGIEDGV